MVRIAVGLGVQEMHVVVGVCDSECRYLDGGVTINYVLSPTGARKKLSSGI